MTRLLLGMSLLAALALPTGCKRSSVEKEPSSSSEKEFPAADDHASGVDDRHDHRDGDGHDHAAQGKDDGHGHGGGEEVDLGTVTLGAMRVSFAQGHGKVVAGKESHLVVKLPHSDKGATVVRAWLGTEDRTLSFVGKGEYAASHDDYDIHAIAPDPLPENVMWWIELQKPDGTKAVGSIKPLLD
jgi:hypothetical protein